MGSGERLEIQTEITNKGEDAFNALLEVQLPMGVSYINANTTDPSVNILCSPPTPMNNNTVQCEVGNPLKANKQVTARVYVMLEKFSRSQYLTVRSVEPLAIVKWHGLNSKVVTRWPGKWKL